MKNVIFVVGFSLFIFKTYSQNNERDIKCFSFERYFKRIEPDLNKFNNRIFTTEKSTIALNEVILCENIGYVEFFKQGVIEATMFYNLDIQPSLQFNTPDSSFFAGKKYTILISSMKLISKSSDGLKFVFQLFINDPVYYTKYHIIEVSVLGKSRFESNRFDLFCKEAHVNCMKFIKTEEAW